MFASDVIYHFLLLSGNFVFIFLPQMSDSNSDWSLGSDRNQCGHKCSITSKWSWFTRNKTSSMKHFLIKNGSEKPFVSNSFKETFFQKFFLLTVSDLHTL